MRSTLVSVLSATALAIASLTVAPSESGTKQTAMPSHGSTADDFTWTLAWDPFDGRYEYVAPFSCTIDKNYAFTSWPASAVDSRSCSRRVWLYDSFTNDTSDWKYCISPGAYRIIPQKYQHPNMIAVGARAVCP